MRFARLALVLSALSLAKPAVTQSKPPRVLLQILHCAKTQESVETSLENGNALKVSFTHYVESEPNAEGFVLVLYESPSKGEVLDFIREFEHGKVWFYLVNNASFSIGSNNGLSVDDALGGVWTQGHLKQRVKKAMRSTYSIPVENLIGPFQNVGCHAYWDPE